MRAISLLLTGFAFLLGAGCKAVGSSTHDPYVATITRTFKDASEQRLITLAEQAPVPETALGTMAAWPSHPPRTVEDWRRDWWSSGFDDVHILQYITPAALDYYQGMLAKFRRGDFHDTNGIKMLSASLTYTAKVSHHDSLELRGRTFPKGSVVTLQLVWRQYCGPICAMTCDAERQVVFDEDGKILAVLGDDDERISLVSDNAVVRPAPAA